ncbi:DUF4142 domain-containing protein [Devosia sp. YIM 151766]|uniref:DUF4142 domain-containing protein n=1 Tax=Devosia sp. YIM 151766 TaxID=3017325 RepID=UPI00255CB62D|nr:DUF4142 domain-containing protein [Devosia sp. YIM 151766]WIY54020.1 DUF4142 domain-containing protein [Devosia sp. YIM 151766]
MSQDNAAATSAAAATNITDPAQFSAIASVSNMFDIESSNLALEKSRRDDVRAFAEQMVADHTKAGDEMATAAAEEGVMPASQLDQQHQKLLDDLNDLDGEAFDAAYILAQQQAHDDAVALFEGYSTNGAAGPLKEFAAATLPTLQEHQAHARDLSAQ